LTTGCCESYGLLGGLTVVPAATDDAKVPAQLITLILLTNWCLMRNLHVYLTKWRLKFQLLYIAIASIKLVGYLA